MFWKPGIIGGYLEFQQMGIVNHRRQMLDAMESNAKGNDNFAAKVINTKTLERNSSLKRKVGEVRRKSQISLISKLLLWAISLKVTSSGQLLYLWNFYLFLNKGLSLGAIYKFTCHSECMTWARTSHAHYCIKIVLNISLES